MKYSLMNFSTSMIFLLIPVTVCADGPVFNLTEYKDASAISAHQDELVTVKLSGKILHASNPQTQSYHAIVPDVQVWLAEYPESKQWKVTSDEEGWWTINLRKHKGVDLEVSLVYAKAGWITTKSNVLTVTDQDDTDLAIQYIDPEYFRSFIKPGIELMIKALQPESDATFTNGVVVTVGKSWASIHDDRLPHGDPGATVNPIPGAIRPLYFDKSVRPNPILTSTSVDGGVVWLNVPKGTHVVEATKEGFEYREAKFAVTEEDVDDEVVLYIASPPDSIQGTNDSGPGED